LTILYLVSDYHHHACLSYSRWAGKTEVHVDETIVFRGCGGVTEEITGVVPPPALIMVSTVGARIRVVVLILGGEHHNSNISILVIITITIFPLSDSASFSSYPLLLFLFLLFILLLLLLLHFILLLISSPFFLFLLSSSFSSYSYSSSLSSQSSPSFFSTSSSSTSSFSSSSISSYCSFSSSNSSSSASLSSPLLLYWRRTSFRCGRTYFLHHWSNLQRHRYTLSRRAEHISAPANPRWKCRIPSRTTFKHAWPAHSSLEQSGTSYCPRATAGQWRVDIRRTTKYNIILSTAELTFLLQTLTGSVYCIQKGTFRLQKSKCFMWM